jgi:hypothetical protein
MQENREYSDSTIFSYMSYVLIDSTLIIGFVWDCSGDGG